MKVAALENALSALTTKLNSHMQTMHNGLSFNELHIRAVNHLCCDVAKEQVKWNPPHPLVEEWEKNNPGKPYLDGQTSIPRGPGSEVDIAWYMENTKQLMIAEFEAAKKAEVERVEATKVKAEKVAEAEAKAEESAETETEADKAEETSIVTEPPAVSSPEGAEVFGGDYGASP